MSQPFFSIVIPTYNRSELFPLAVQSILNQTFKDFEIIVSDNYSADPTPEVVKRFTDPRVKYVRTPVHYTIADAWEFARTHANGQFIMMLSDDDALVSSALERFADEAKNQDADFLFSSVAEYRDLSFPGIDRNSVSCPGFSGTSRVISVDEFVRPLFSFRPKFNMHPSAFTFPKKIADYVERRTGRYFWTNGVEYSAWPITAQFAKRIVRIDVPLTILGRTGKSWGANIALCNPGKEKIETLIKDVDQVRKHAPLNNFTMINLMAEGMLTAKHLFPKEFASYEFDELRYLRATMSELRRRRAMGVDVSAEIDDTLRYARKYPSMDKELCEITAPKESEENGFVQLIRAGIGKLGARQIRERILAFQLGHKLQKGEACQGFHASGEAFEFSDILGCSKFFEKYVVNSRVIASTSKYVETGREKAIFSL